MPDRDRTIARAVACWFAVAARRLPWRTTPRDPYRSLVSEFMLQQTQVSRVLERYGAFLERFPSVRALGEADEQEVLALWSGLGYYQRARRLHACAEAIVREHGGRTPSEPDALRSLPGVGRYTSGAIASIVFGRREAVVDGNVTRVLMRVEGREGPQDARDTQRWAWGRAQALVDASDDPGPFNEGLMELGATVCTPASPRCDACPLSGLCTARRNGRVGEIPPPRAPAKRSTLHASSVIVRDGEGRVVVRKRDTRRMWGGLWEAPTLETTGRPAGASRLRSMIDAPPGSRLRRSDAFEHVTTHRLVKFRVHVLEGGEGAAARAVRAIEGARLVALDEALGLGISNAQRRLLQEHAGEAQRVSSDA